MVCRGYCAQLALLPEASCYNHLSQQFPLEMSGLLPSQSPGPPSPKATKLVMEKAWFLQSAQFVVVCAAAVPVLIRCGIEPYLSVRFCRLCLTQTLPNC